MGFSYHFLEDASISDISNLLNKYVVESKTISGAATKDLNSLLLTTFDALLESGIDI